MKNLIVLLFAATSFIACNKKANDTEMENQSTVETMETTTTASDTIYTTETVAFACPMHPEQTGKKDDKCPKCEMPLTVQVTP